MKLYTRWAHRMVRMWKLENACLLLAGIVPVARKLLPLPEEYTPGERLLIQRDGAFFEVDRSDYMQWHTYASLPDASWKKAASVLTSGCVVLDIGANCGQFSLKLAAALYKQTAAVFAIHAFEPNPEIFGRLVSNLEHNKQWKEHVLCHPLALGMENGEVPFAYDPSNSGGGGITTAPSRHRIRIEKLDDVVRSLSLTRVDFIKIDVEGFEPEVLLGGTGVIEKFRPWLYIEITPEWFAARGHTREHLIEKLLSWGYSLWGEVREDFLPYLENEQQFRSLHQFNLLAKPPKIGE